MKNTIRELIENDIYEHIQYYADIIDEKENEAVIHGIHVMEDPCNFVQGALVNATALLYIHCMENGDENGERVLKQLNKFIGLTCQEELRTWGKLNVLRGLVALKKNGLLHKLNENYLEVLKEKTNYEDFFSKETLTVIGYPSNYMQVAMSCAAMREALGWDEGEISKQILSRIVDVMNTYSCAGYLDEQPPCGRFDRYSMLVSTEIADTLRFVQYEVPESILANLKKVTEAVIQMANTRGDGINYGRSLSCHGDSAVLEILSTAMALQLVDEKYQEEALLYSIHIVQKLLNFWYDKELKGFNIWWNGRNTNAYRGKERFLEVNLDMPLHLLSVLHNFEEAGLADVPEPDIALPTPEQWKMYKITFKDELERKAETIILRKKDTLAMLPLIGIGRYVKNSAYQPYPAICGILEAPPESEYPFLIPEYSTKDGRKYRPTQFYSEIYSEEKDGYVKITAKGNLTELLAEGNSEKADYRFVAEYTFDDNRIQAVFETELIQDKTEMFVGIHNENCRILTQGFDGCTDIEYDPKDFDTPHGAITDGKMYYKNGAGKVSYAVNA